MPKIQVTFKNYHQEASLDILPDECPYCHVKIHPYIIANSFPNLESNEYLEVAYKCTNSTCKHLFVAQYFNLPNSSDEWRYVFSHILRATPKVTTDFPDLVIALSPEFVAVYTQAEKAEATGLDKIAGMGYRKALEFLTKDYLIHLEPSQGNIIKSKLLGACISDVTDQRIQNLAKRAAWLGNDETHYVRKWVSKDISDLKTLIKMVVHHIDADLVYQDIMRTMP